MNHTIQQSKWQLHFFRKRAKWARSDDFDYFSEVDVPCP